MTNTYVKWGYETLAVCTLSMCLMIFKHLWNLKGGDIDKEMVNTWFYTGDVPEAEDKKQKWCVQQDVWFSSEKGKSIDSILQEELDLLLEEKNGERKALFQLFGKRMTECKEWQLYASNLFNAIIYSKVVKMGEEEIEYFQGSGSPFVSYTSKTKGNKDSKELKELQVDDAGEEEKLILGGKKDTKRKKDTKLNVLEFFGGSIDGTDFGDLEKDEETCFLSSNNKKMFSQVLRFVQKNSNLIHETFSFNGYGGTQDKQQYLTVTAPMFAGYFLQQNNMWDAQKGKNMIEHSKVERENFLIKFIHPILRHRKNEGQASLLGLLWDFLTFPQLQRIFIMHMAVAKGFPLKRLTLEEALEGLGANLEWDDVEDLENWNLVISDPENKFFKYIHDSTKKFPRELSEVFPEDMVAEIAQKLEAAAEARRKNDEEEDDDDDDDDEGDDMDEDDGDDKKEDEAGDEEEGEEEEMNDEEVEKGKEEEEEEKEKKNDEEVVEEEKKNDEEVKEIPPSDQDVESEPGKVTGGPQKKKRGRNPVPPPTKNAKPPVKKTSPVPAPVAGIRPPQKSVTKNAPKDAHAPKKKPQSKKKVKK
jgi:hypothetical protein